MIGVNTCSQLGETALLNGVTLPRYHNAWPQES